jgi:hypothetical protein
MATLPNSSIGLNSANIAEANIPEAVWNYVSKHHLGKAMAGEPLEKAPVPKGTVAPAGTLRKRILELSLAPDIYMISRLQPKGTARLG